MKRVVLPLIIIIFGFGLAATLIATGPKLEPKPVVSLVPLVRVMKVEPATIQMTTTTHGTVEPRTESELIPEVSGRITAISDAMVSGGFFSQGDMLLTIDPLDYEEALEQSKAGLARAKSELDNAQKAHIRQLDLAKRNLTSDAQKDDTSNRLSVAKASVREVIARLSRAERDLVRTEIRAPYDGRVRSEKVDIGQFVNRGNAVAMIYATDISEVRLPINDEELAFIDLSLATGGIGNNKPVTVSLKADFAGAEHAWQGTVVRTEGELDPNTRMLNVVAQVQRPYEQSQNRPPLAVGLFVEAEIHGATFNNVVVLPRVALRPNNQVYVIDSEGKLRFRKVDVLRIVEEDVFIQAGLRRGELVCVSPLEAAIDGMPVRIPDSKNMAKL
ncbi:MAG: RND family efflux transporter MFP subunit [Candidatus Azotimanducaceae bacterium]